MASRLTLDEVAHIADLARLDLSAAERETFARQLTDILAYAAVVQQVDTSAVASDGAAGPAGPDETDLREDVRAPSTSREAALDQAPDGVQDAGLFRVPKVL
jgi:aspartyl-tRNA(Asn)/glutamyl-tRNA(Gln) amidotransferase subunit C